MKRKHPGTIKVFLRTISQMFALTNKRDKKTLTWLTLGSILLSIIETFSISMIMPFITLASSPDLVLSNRYGHAVYEALHFSSPLHFAYLFAFMLVGLYLFRMGYSLLFTYLYTRFSSHKAHDLAQQLFMCYLKISYLEHITMDVNHTRNTINSKSYQVLESFGALIGIFTEITTVLFLYSMLVLTNWKMTLVLSVILILQVIFISKYVAKIIQKKGQAITTSNIGADQVFAKFFGNFKITKLKDKYLQAHSDFSQSSLSRAKIQTTTQTLQAIPTKFLETVGFSLLILSVVYVLHKYGDAKMVLPIISMYALALYRMLPSISKILGCFNTILYSQHAITNIYRELKRPIQEEGDLPLRFSQNIILQNIYFAYRRSHPILQNINLTIKKGQKVAFIGPSGCGKSTLVDIIIGVLYPNKGTIFIDEKPLDSQNIRSWRQKIGYIPQNIYLFDGTVADNVACGSPLDEKRVIEVCKRACIYDFLCTHNGIESRIGEGGINLSGGQKQRIGIARALYDDPEVLVLDEATSALDTSTETKIMDEIYAITQDKTLLVIAHRLSTIERCDVKIDLSQPL
ncbi:multidrug transporter [Helicobacter suis HS1]|nr:ABC-transporter, ATP-binding domain [Helicobacter suis HS1]BDR28793.1 multidrug transporter [Helicobacter suis HS1]